MSIMRSSEFPESFDGEVVAGAGGFIHDPNAVIAAYFLKVERPKPGDMNAVAGLISGPWREPEETRDVLNICTDLVFRVPNVTTVLAGMFDTGHGGLPPRWREAYLARAILTNVADMEAARLRSEQRLMMDGPTLPGLAERLAEIHQFMSDLQARRA